MTRCDIIALLAIHHYTQYLFEINNANNDHTKAIKIKISENLD